MEKGPKDLVDWFFHGFELALAAICLWVLVLGILAGCAAAQPKKSPSRQITGMLGHICEETRPVKCAADLDDADCQRVVDSVKVINATIGRTLLVFKGRSEKGLSAAGMREEIASGTIVVVQAHTKLPPDMRPLGITMALDDDYTEPHSGCLKSIYVVLVAPPGEMPENVRDMMVAHELLHAVGIPHSTWPKNESLMEPAASLRAPGATAAMNAADVAALRSIYSTVPFEE